MSRQFFIFSCDWSSFVVMPKEREKKKINELDFTSSSFLDDENDDDDDINIHSFLEADIQDLQSNPLEIQRKPNLLSKTKKKEIMDVAKVRINILFDQELETYLKENYDFHSYKQITQSIIAEEFKLFQKLSKTEGITILASTEKKGSDRTELINSFFAQFNLHIEKIVENLRVKGVFKNVEDENES